MIVNPNAQTHLQGNLQRNKNSDILLPPYHPLSLAVALLFFPFKILTSLKYTSLSLKYELFSTLKMVEIPSFTIHSGVLLS